MKKLKSKNETFREMFLKYMKTETKIKILLNL
jgi:hypothetical protein